MNILRILRKNLKAFSIKYEIVLIKKKVFLIRTAEKCMYFEKSISFTFANKERFHENEFSQNASSRPDIDVDSIVFDGQNQFWGSVITGHNVRSVFAFGANNFG
jgi:hypothetical protein